MKDQKIETEIGSEIAVTVYFDYQPEEKEESNYPGCPAEVTLNSVCVNGVNGADILECLADLECAWLEERCMDSVIEAARLAYEESQEER